MSFSIITKVNAAVDAAALDKVIDPIITNIVDPLIILAFAVAMVVFVYGVIQMMTHDADAEEHKKGRWSMVGGVIGMFIMVSAWGIIQLVANTVKQF